MSLNLSLIRGLNTNILLTFTTHYVCTSVCKCTRKIKLEHSLSATQTSLLIAAVKTVAAAMICDRTYIYNNIPQETLCDMIIISKFSSKFYI